MVTNLSKIKKRDNLNKSQVLKSRKTSELTGDPVITEQYSSVFNFYKDSPPIRSSY